MRAFLIFATFVVAVSARPDIGLKLREQGYDYPSPGAGGHGGGHGGGHSGGGHSGGGHSAPVSSYEAPLVSGNEYQQSSGQGFSSNQGGFGGSQQGSGLSSFGGSSGNGGQSSNFGSGSSGNFGQSSNFGSGSGQSFGGSSGNSGSSSFGGSSSGGFGSSQGSSGGGFGSGNDLTRGESQVIDLSGGSSGGQVIYKPVIRQGEPIVTKHFYVHEAPEEPANVRVEEKVQEVRPQKHYKIIFIKAPSSEAAGGSNNYPVYPQNEEKTIVYVLSKKNENNFENGEIPTPPPAVTSKPEVFFIKYKNKEEADSAVSKIQESFQEGGPGYNSPASFAQGIGASSGGASSSSFSQGSSSGGSQNFGGGSQIGKSDIRAGNDFVPQNFGGSSGSGGFTSGGGSSSGENNFQSVSTGGSFQAPGGNSIGSFQSQVSSFGGSSGGSDHSSGGGFGGSFSSGGDNQIIPQRMLEIPADESAFQTYLPPNSK